MEEFVRVNSIMAHHLKIGSHKFVDDLKRLPLNPLRNAHNESIRGLNALPQVYDLLDSDLS